MRLLTRTFRFLQVVQPLELPGMPPMLEVGIDLVGAFDLALWIEAALREGGKRKLQKG